MNTDFLKLKNAYGIKELKRPNLIEGQTLVYAPNGVMKTSFADALENIRKGEPIIDAFGEYDSIAEYEIKQHSKTYTESNNDGTLQLLIFTSKSVKDNVFTDPNIANIAMNAESRRSYDEQVKKLGELRKSIDSIVSLSIKGSKRTVGGSWESIASIFETKDESDTLKALTEYEKVDEKLFGDASFSKVCDDKIMKVFEDRDFANKIELYKDIVNHKMETKIFNNGFDLFQLESIANTIIDTHYFDAKHSLNISDLKIDSAEKLIDLVESEKANIFASPEVETAFLDVKAKLTANAATRGFSDFFSEKRDIVDYSSDYNEARKTFCRTKIAGREDEIKQLAIEFDKCLNKIKSLINMAKTEESEWKRAKDLFNSRFSLNRVDLEINEHVENGVPVPRITIIDKATRKEMNINMERRLSSGELRALYILNLLFEIESKKKMWPDGFTIVLDDIADSFDYKNKYAICRYIEELFDNDSIQTIVMTHNYDFYRCCKFFLSKINHKELVASKLRNGEVELKKAGHSELQNLSFTRLWKTMIQKEKDASLDQEATIIAYLPVLRNSIEIERGDDFDSEYPLICQYLHYSLSKYSSTLLDLKPLLEKHGISLREEYYDMSFKDILSKAYSRYEKGVKIDQFDIRSKIALAIVLRVLHEKFLVQKSGKSPFDYKEDNSDKKYKGMYEQLLNSGRLSQKDIEWCEFARIVANPYIHVNAFMYEQLIDNSGDKIVQCIKYFKTEIGF